MSAKPTSAVKPLDPSAAASAGWSAEEIRWEALAEQAAAHAVAGRMGEAMPLWAEALYLARTAFAANDPRLATSIANHAHALRLGGDAALAADLFREALAIWDASPPWVAGLRIERRARSSLYHLRMEAKHWKTYEATARKRLAAFAAEGRAAVAALAEDGPAGSRGLARWWSEKPSGFTDGRKLLAAALLIIRTDEVGTG